MKEAPHIPNIPRNDDNERIPLVSSPLCEKCGCFTVIIRTDCQPLFDSMNPDMIEGCRIRFVARCTECLHDASYRLGVYATVWPIDCQKDNPRLAELVRKRELNDLRRLTDKYADNGKVCAVRDSGTTCTIDDD